MSQITRTDAGITRATLICEMEDGTTLSCSGHPSYVDEFSINAQADEIDLMCLRGKTRDFYTPGGRMVVKFNGQWTNPTTSAGQAPRGWAGRFKKWLKEFPLR